MKMESAIKRTGTINTSRKTIRIYLILFIACIFLFSCASRNTARAEEYFSIGMAYFDMGKYAEAEQWLNRAVAMDKTMTASEYNLGRISFERGRYDEAVLHFENVLIKDPDNVMALKAAAYSQIKNRNLEKAEAHYNRVLELVPESVDDGYNYALVLYGLSKYETCEIVLNKYPFALKENAPSILLLARAQKAQNKVEAADSYDKWLIAAGTPGAQGLYEYAQVLESAGLYARALEQYKAAINALTEDTKELRKSKIRFEEARLIMIADPENEEGISELNLAVSEGFMDTAAVEDLLLDERITQANKDEIKNTINVIKNKDKPPEESKKTEEDNSQPAS